MRVGVHVVNFTLPDGPAAIASTLIELCRAAEDAGVSNLSAMDHYLQLDMAGGPEQPMLEGYTTLGFLAAHTRSVELQLLVTGVTYRHPGLLAKIVTISHIIGERDASRASLGPHFSTAAAATLDRDRRLRGRPCRSGHAPAGSSQGIPRRDCHRATRR